MSVQKAIYANDTRRNISSMDQRNAFTKKIKEQAKSVACLVSMQNLTPTLDQGYRLRVMPPTLEACTQAKYGAPLAPNEPFRREPVFCRGTAFLVSRRLALTAAHCVCLQDLDILRPDINEITLIFGVQVTNQAPNLNTFEKKQVYSVVHVIAHQFDDQKDWALLELDREVESLTPLALDFQQAQTEMGLSIYMLGHPSGLPLKYSGEGRVDSVSAQKFTASINSFHGNSGSPIFNKTTKKIIGILIRGEKDYELNPLAGTVSTYYVKAGQHEVSQMTMAYIQQALLTYHSQVKEGLNLRTLCPTFDCYAYTREVVIRRLSGSFDLGKEGCTAPLPCCGKKVQTLASMALLSCRYSYEGADEHEDWHQQGMQLVGPIPLEITPHFHNWQYCKLTVQRA